MKATSLEQITSDYYFIMEKLELALAILQRKEQVEYVAVFYESVDQYIQTGKMKELANLGPRGIPI